jgi:hypothetical protein
LGSFDCDLEVHSTAKFSTNKRTSILTQQHGSCNITSNLYPGGGWFESHLWRWLSWLEFSLVFLSLPFTSFPIHYSLPPNYLMLFTNYRHH